MTSGRRSQRFRCYWCSRVLIARYLHHVERSVQPSRNCCATCHADPEGTYRKIYPGGQTEEAESIRSVQCRDLEESSG